jgi:hypothetical protein
VIERLEKMSTANVYYVLNNTTVYTDKLRVNSDGEFTYQVYAVALGTANAVGNLYSQPIGFPAGSYDLYSGVGNKVTIVSSGNVSALELGTASSATAGVIGGGSY